MPIRFFIFIYVFLFFGFCLCETSKYVPKWKKQACEQQNTVTPNRKAHYVCTDEGEIKCHPGWTGDLCDVPICKKGCDPLFGYCRKPNECVCKLGYHGELCNKCIRMIGCEHGYCNSSFQCICREGWDGLFCSEPICRSDCHKNHGFCTVPNECKCKFGWTGKNCSDCQTLPGCKNGFCNNPLDCLCKDGYKGVFCQIPKCSENCHSIHGYCKKPGECICKTGWQGANCDICYPYPGCKNGNCVQPWECNCLPGWGGQLCDKELTYCNKNPKLCKNGAKCVSLEADQGNYTCQCAGNYTGQSCDVLKPQNQIAYENKYVKRIGIPLNSNNWQKKRKVIKTTVFEDAESF